MPGKSEVVAIVGAGPVGALQACILADRGYRVNLYEMRDDIRKSPKLFGRSINLALSVRGRSALRMAGLEEEVTRNGIEMYGRMIHDRDGSTHFIQYGTKDQNIMSIDRRKLNELLISAAERRQGVSIKFQQKLVGCDIENKKLILEKVDDDGCEDSFDLVMGCDGAFSMLRSQMMKTSRFNFSQEFIADCYLELRIPPRQDRQFALTKNCLHIWPRGDFMLIGLPNVEDHSFVMTLFMPQQIFQHLISEADIIDFFKTHFKDALELVTEESVLKAFQKLTPLPLVTIKCSPYNYKGCGLLLGDSAHAMVPFYGQGLNCGFEDLKVFEELMNQYDDDFEKVLPEFSKYRSIDAQTMNDLALYNYKEMRDHVNSKLFLARKMLDNFLYRLLPNLWIPLYTSVSFTRIRYHECMLNREWQDRTIRKVSFVLSASFLAAMCYLGFKKGGVSLILEHSRLLWNRLLERI